MLDVCCGTGIMIPYLLKTEAARVTGIDIAPKMIENAKKKYHNDRLTFVLGDIYDYNEPGWNVVLIYNAFPHLLDALIL